ncbi:small conductance mechanosensitive channel [Acetitomaculum ruminis DSM 5522]|uniref:Small conductance mechanosensitive channel n=1 Tax=Acetitomaculum ruminis DSM 5522 TaxID=1120918 RepID=A0A1I0VL33_9FIRM|nr:mechanosensitive ion channel domain-containing protein [Acetitomaculum ruminis]SFA76928.1 small conductance mechanosensitive channel [Acetitomaculum ruminis DSM 5522]
MNFKSFILASISNADSISDVTDAAKELTDVSENTKMLEKYIQSITPHVINFIINLILVVIVFLIGRKVITIIRNIVRKSLEKSNVDIGAEQFLDSTLKIVLYFILFVIIGSSFGLTASTVVALLGSFGVTVGLALQGGLANFAGGIILLLIKPFKVGDYIKSTTTNLEGTVEEIQFFYTKLLTVENIMQVIPNGVLADNSIINYSNEEKRMIRLRVPVAYNSDIKHVKNVIRSVLDNEKRILKDEAVKIVLDEYGDSAMIIEVRAFVKTPDFFETKWSLLEIIKEEFDKNSIEIPYNKLDINIKK